MNTRRDFLNLTMKSSAVVAAAGFVPKRALASEGVYRDDEVQSSPTPSGSHYRPPFRFGMGGVPLGNEFEFVTDEEAYATIEAAWNAGVRYYDMAPWYGLGLAERR